MRTNALLVIVVAAAGCYRVPPSSSTQPMQTTEQPSPPAAAPKTPDLDRGKYLASIAGCAVCHTPLAANGQPDTSRLFAGGLEDKLPGGGTFRAPNITPDRGTGIGAWTDEQIIAAVRRGVRPDGAHLLPIMPYPYYHKLTDSDAQALVAYLRSIPPIPNHVAKSDPGAMRPLDLEEPIGNVDSPAMHGEYLASLMHCAACHTPQDGPFAARAFSGGTQFPTQAGVTLVAPNITADRDTGIGDWSEDDVVRSVRAMTLPDGSKIRGPMAMYASAWSQLTDADAHAVAGYIKSLPAIAHDVRMDKAPAAPQGTD